MDGELRTADLTTNIKETTQTVVPPSEAANENSYKRGHFVTAVYEKKFYIAQIETISDTATTAELSFMRPSGLSKCNWPAKPDLLNVLLCDILGIVDAPAPVSNSSRFVSLA